MPTLVYRIEHKDTGKGPYQRTESGMFPVIEMIFAHSTPKHPGPDFDKVLKNHPVTDWKSNLQLSDHLFGFATEREAYAWFDGFRRKLHAKGFVVRTYSVHKRAVIVGDKQVVFRMEKCRPVAVQPLIRGAKLPA